jgi:ferredoxin
LTGVEDVTRSSDTSEKGAPTASPSTSGAATPRAETDLRRFHLRGAAPGVAVLPEGLLPVLLEPFRTAPLSASWPLVLPLSDGRTEAPLFVPLSDALKKAAAPAGEAPGPLQENLPRVERWLHGEIGGEAAPVDVAPLLERAGAALRAELSLAPETDERLGKDWSAFAAALPAGSRFLAYSEIAPLYLLLGAARRRLAARRDAFRREVSDLARQIHLILGVEKVKERARDPEALRAAVGDAGMKYLDPAKLAELVPTHKGSLPMDPQREYRVREALSKLESLHPEQTAGTLVLVHDGGLDGGALRGESGWSEQRADDPCAAAIDAFDREAAKWVELFRACRIARLEVAGRFEPARHAAWVEEFSPRSFSKDELALLPLVVAFDRAARIAGGGMVSLSRLLRSGLPIHAIVPVHPARNPGAPVEDPLAGHRLEIGYLGIGHRTAFVQQSSAARPAHLVDGYLRALETPRPALHVLAVAPEGDAASPAWLREGAALECRAHPFFRYDPEAGATWAGRMSFAENPQVEEDWPIHERSAEEGTPPERLAFTFADFALLDAALHDHFCVVPDDYDAEALAPLPEWLGLGEDDALKKLPFVLATDGAGAVKKLAVTRRLTSACRERLDFWHTLQELCGVRNQYVLEATRGLREELEETKRSAQSAAMQTLAQRLLQELGVSMQVPAPGATAPAPAAPASTPTAPAPAAAAPAAIAAEPWIDTPLCTSCNDCMAINPLVFVYDKNKQAKIGDPRKGTFAQLVKAAEKCPAKCIHPGKPLHPDEPGLEALIKRAAKYQ